VVSITSPPDFFAIKREGITILTQEDTHLLYIPRFVFLHRGFSKLGFSMYRDLHWHFDGVGFGYLYDFFMGLGRHETRHDGDEDNNRTESQ